GFDRPSRFFSESRPVISSGLAFGLKSCASASFATPACAAVRETLRFYRRGLIADPKQPRTVVHGRCTETEAADGPREQQLASRPPLTEADHVPIGVANTELASAPALIDGAADRLDPAAPELGEEIVDVVAEDVDVRRPAADGSVRERCHVQLDAVAL